ncbi:MAG TPA: YfiR family protein [Thermoanaerobaculia bacterium]|nr:YfiR family protein [Thermoanaerobaculia bacterium]
MVTPRIAFFAIALTVTGTLSAQTVADAEYRIKAVFLFNFVQFVEWPPNAFANENAPLALCVLGTDPFGESLDQVVAGESVQNRRLVVRRPNITEIDDCHLLFVSKSEQPRLGEVLQHVGSAPVLTVSDIDGFVTRGGTIGFYLDRKRVRFEISPSRAQTRGLKMSSQLLGLGKIHHSGPKGGGP